jgi:methylamine---glutamate N-methyltransferase subunit C
MIKPFVEDTKPNRKKCVCPNCPSFPEGCRSDILYCGTGKSSCDVRSKGCKCSICPVFKENKLKDNYFCHMEEEGESNTIMRKKHSDEDSDFYQAMVDIKDVAERGKSVVRSMGSLKKMPFSLNDLHFVPAQVYRIPLNIEDKVNTEVVIGPSCEKPLKVSSPIMISGMSFGAVSKKVRLIISQVAANLKIAANSGEGGVISEELQAASKYLITQYATGRFGISDEILKNSAAIEVRFGQGAYPGKGSFLPAEKITPEIAKARRIKAGEPAYSPAHHPDMKTPEEIRDKLTYLKALTKGAPIGAKIGCGNIEEDIKVLVGAGIDFIAIDGFGGGTGATDFYVRENVGIPIVAAITRAHKFLKRLDVRDDVTLIASGGLRTSADFAKCLALGADAVYIGTAALIAINCQQNRVCQTGLCPTGIATHDPKLLEQLDVSEGVRKLSNFISTSTLEVANLARIVGKDDVNKLGIEDLVSLKKELSEITGVKWVTGQ